MSNALETLLDMARDVKIDPHHSTRPPPTALSTNVEKPKFPQYAVYSKRLESFEAWPEYIPVDKIDLVDAGLVYTGIGDNVRCYFCGVRLRNWERGDVPMEEHAKWYPKCPYIQLVKAQAYIEKLRRGEKPEVAGNTSNGHNDSSTATDIINSVAAQSCIQMGYKDDIVQKAIDIYKNKYGNNDFKGKDLCEIIFELDEIPEATDREDQSQIVQVDSDTLNEDTGNNDFIGTDPCEIPFEFDENPDASLTQTVKEDNIQITQVDSDTSFEFIEPLETLSDENQRLKENQKCKIGLDSRADVIFLPCGHMVSCCPECRKK